MLRSLSPRRIAVQGLALKTEVPVHLMESFTLRKTFNLLLAQLDSRPKLRMSSLHYRAGCRGTSPALGKEVTSSDKPSHN